MEFSRQEYWSGLPFPSPGNLPYPGIEPGSPTLQADSLLSKPQGKPRDINYLILNYRLNAIIFSLSFVLNALIIKISFGFLVELDKEIIRKLKVAIIILLEGKKGGRICSTRYQDLLQKYSNSEVKY